MNYDQMKLDMPPFVHDDPPFVAQLAAHEPFIPNWEKECTPHADELDLRPGICLVNLFADSDGLLETVFADFRLFLDETSGFKQDFI